MRAVQAAGRGPARATRSAWASRSARGPRGSGRSRTDTRAPAGRIVPSPAEGQVADSRLEPDRPVARIDELPLGRDPETWTRDERGSARLCPGRPGPRERSRSRRRRTRAVPGTGTGQGPATSIGPKWVRHAGMRSVSTRRSAGSHHEGWLSDHDQGAVRQLGQGDHRSRAARRGNGGGCIAGRTSGTRRRAAASAWAAPAGRDRVGCRGAEIGCLLVTEAIRVSIAGESGGPASGAGDATHYTRSAVAGIEECAATGHGCDPPRRRCRGVSAAIQPDIRTIGMPGPGMGRAAGQVEARRRRGCGWPA